MITHDSNGNKLKHCYMYSVNTGLPVICLYDEVGDPVLHWLWATRRKPPMSTSTHKCVGLTPIEWEETTLNAPVLIMDLNEFFHSLDTKMREIIRAKM